MKVELLKLPHDLDSERKVIGGLLLDNSLESLNLCLVSLTASVFYSEANQTIYRELIEHHEATKKPIDPEIFIKELDKKQLLEKVGNADIFCSGHIHQNCRQERPQRRLTDMGREYIAPVLHLLIPSYKTTPLTTFTKKGYAIEKEYPPTLPGGMWLKFWLQSDQILFDAEVAK